MNLGHGVAMRQFKLALCLLVVQGCAAPSETFKIIGSLNGLKGTGLVLQNNESDSVQPAADGKFTFSTPLQDNTRYRVTVLKQPTNPSQTCTVQNNIGAIIGSNVTDIVVNCVVNQFTVGGSVFGLGSGISLSLQTAVGDVVTVGANGPFTFPTKIDDGTSFVISISALPSNQDSQCSVIAGNGKINNANATSTVVTCLQPAKAYYQLDGQPTQWNDYVTADSAGGASVSATSCSPASFDLSATASYKSCIHAGERRTVLIPGVTSCKDWSITDSASAFDWTCDATTDPQNIQFVSMGLKAGVGLRDLIDYSTTPNPTWKKTHIDAANVDGSHLQTSDTQWWNNPMQLLDGNPPASWTSGTIYIVNALQLANYDLSVHSADKIAFVVSSASSAYQLTHPCDRSGAILTAAKQNFLWIEGAINDSCTTGINASSAISLFQTQFSVVNHVVIDVMQEGDGIVLTQSNNNLLRDIHIGSVHGTGIVTNSSLGNIVD